MAAMIAIAQNGIDGANAIVIRNSKMKTSSWTTYPYMQLKADAFLCDSVPQYMAWEYRATR